MKLWHAAVPLLGLLAVAILIWHYVHPGQQDTISLPGNVQIQFPVAVRYQENPVGQPHDVLGLGNSPDHREGFVVVSLPGVHFAAFGPGNDDVIQKLSSLVPQPYGGLPATSFVRHNHVVIQFMHPNGERTYFCDVWENDSGLVMLMAELRSPAEALKIKINFESKDR